MGYLYFLILLVLIGLGDVKSKEPELPNPKFGPIAFVVNDSTELPQEENKECSCGGTKKIKSGDGLIEIPCGCENCKCEKVGQKFEVQPIQTEMDLQKYNRYIPRNKKELWILMGEPGTCPPCEVEKKDLELMRKNGWKICKKFEDEKTHIRIMQIDELDTIPDLFLKKGIDENGRRTAEILVPTHVFWENYKIKIIHHGKLDMWQIKKIFDGEKYENTN